jgi:hypothetical protein
MSTENEAESDDLDLPIVDLLPAYAWVCEDCNRLNFQQFEDGGIEAREVIYRIIHGLGDDEELPIGWADEINPDGLIIAPETVTCIGCKTTFAASTESLDIMLENLDEVADEYEDDEDEFDEYGDGEDYYYNPDWEDV